MNKVLRSKELGITSKTDIDDVSDMQQNLEHITYRHVSNLVLKFQA
jgi:hypothetical protein